MHTPNTVNAFQPPSLQKHARVTSSWKECETWSGGVKTNALDCTTATLEGYGNTVDQFHCCCFNLFHQSIYLCCVKKNKYKLYWHSNFILFYFFKYQKLETDAFFFFFLNKLLTSNIISKIKDSLQDNGTNIFRIGNFHYARTGWCKLIWQQGQAKLEACA